MKKYPDQVGLKKVSNDFDISNDSQLLFQFRLARRGTHTRTMVKFYCDYCDSYLTHDSRSVRKTHFTGKKHKDGVREYYQQWLERAAAKLIAKTQQAYKTGRIDGSAAATMAMCDLTNAPLTEHERQHHEAIMSGSVGQAPGAPGIKSAEKFHQQGGSRNDPNFYGSNMMKRSDPRVAAIHNYSAFKKTNND